MDFNAMFQTWMNVLTKPGEPVFEEERRKPNANLTTALIWVAIAGVVAAIFGAIAAVIFSFIGSSVSLISMLADNLPPEVAAQLAGANLGGGLGAGVGQACANIIIIPIVFLMSAAVHFGVAKAVGGTGSFEEHTYVHATVRAPIIVASSVINIIPVLGTCVSVLLIIYQIVLTYFSMKVVHNLTSGKALLVALAIPILFALCLICLFAVIFAGVFSAAAGSF